MLRLKRILYRSHDLLHPRFKAPKYFYFLNLLLHHNTRHHIHCRNPHFAFLLFILFLFYHHFDSLLQAFSNIVIFSYFPHIQAFLKIHQSEGEHGHFSTNILFRMHNWFTSEHLHLQISNQLNFLSPHWSAFQDSFSLALLFYRI